MIAGVQGRRIRRRSRNISKDEKNQLVFEWDRYQYDDTRFRLLPRDAFVS